MPWTDDEPNSKETNRRLGSCPYCGHNIWELDELRMRRLDEPKVRLFQCLECKETVLDRDIIPF